jgi:hypothetical protein
MDAVDPRLLPGPSIRVVVGNQRLRLGRGQAPLDATQLADVGTPRILKLRVSLHLACCVPPGELEQQVVELRNRAEEREEELEAARGANRQLLANLNRRI